MKTYRRPSSGVVWLHVDNPRRKDGRVWALQWLEPDGTLRYECVAAVSVRAVGETMTWPKGRQPRIVVAFQGAAVEIFGQTLAVIRSS